MKRLRQTFLAARVLGVFLFILTSALIIIGLGIFNIFGIDSGIRAVDNHSHQRFVLESIEYYILDQEIAERRYLTGTYESTTTNPQDVTCGDDIQPIGNSSQPDLLFAVAECNLNLLIEEYEDLGASDSTLAIIEHEREMIREDFQHITSGNAEELDEDDLDLMFRSEGSINYELDNLVFETNIALEEATDELAQNDRQATILGFLGLLIFPLLAVWAFLVVSRLTRPLLTLKNVVVSIGGAHYNPELFNDTIRRNDVMGDLAHALEDMASFVNQRETELEKEVETLNAEYERLRRRQINITAARRSKHV